MMNSGFYSIPLTGLKEGSHEYEFKVNGEFFEDFENSEVIAGELKAVVTLVKRSVHMELNIRIEGFVKLTCNRCLEEYDQKVETNNSLLIKYGEQWEEVNDEVVMILFGENMLDISQYIYEFVHLGLPLGRYHPDDEAGNSTCNPEMLDKLEQHNAEQDNIIDPRWNDLGKLKEGIENK